MNEHEARMAIASRISEVLLDLAQDGLEESDDIEEMRDAMDDAAELVMEALGIEVVSISGPQVSVRMTVPDPDA